MTTPDDLFNPLDETECQQLDEFLLSLEYEEGIYCISELNGFFTAVVSGPIMIPPSQWLQSIWGDHEHSPGWESEEAFQQVFALLVRHMNSTAATLMEASMEFEPCFMKRTVEETCYTVVDEWCEGYMKGVALCPERWGEMPCAREDYLAPMLMFTKDGWQQLEKMTDDEVRFWQGQIEPAARRIHAYWLERRSDTSGAQFQPASAANDEPFIRTKPKVGRNNPCPCGSGKKYKKCRGLH